MRPVPLTLTVRVTKALVSFAPLAFKLFCAARQNAVLRRSHFPSLDTFHLLSGWLKDLAPANIRSIFVTLPALTKSRGAGRRRGSLVVPLCLAFSFLLFDESYNLLMLTRLLVVFVKGLHRRDLPSDSDFFQVHFRRRHHYRYLRNFPNQD